jgi:hypothetical protein
MPAGTATSRVAHSPLLIFAVAAFGLGVAVLSPGMPPPQPAAHLAPPAQATLSGTERPLPTSDEHPAATTSQEDGVWTTPGIRPEVGSSIPFIETCTTWINPDRDLRLVLANMAMQQRRIAPERLTGRLIAPPKQDVPLMNSVLSDQPSLALAEAAAARAADRSPLATPQPTGPVC